MGAERELIIIVDDDITNLTIARKNLAEKYAVFTAPSGKKLFSLLEKAEPDLILLDVSMPEMSGYEIINILKSDEKTKNIPVIFLTANSGGDDELEGLSLGAIDYIAKPFSPPLLCKRIELHLLLEEQKRKLEAQKTELIEINNNLQELVEAKTQSVVQLQNALLHTMAELVEYRDDITGGHIQRTHRYLEILLAELMRSGVYKEEVSTWDINLVLQSAQLHDVGKIAIPDVILLKPGKLTPEEFETIKTHTIFGERVIAKVRESTTDHAFLDYAEKFIAAHHEKWDGSGYPKGLREDGIPLLGRLMAIADVYDALVSERPYKQAFSHEKAVDIINKSKGSHFDPVLVGVFLACDDEIRKAGGGV